MIINLNLKKWRKKKEQKLLHKNEFHTKLLCATVLYYSYKKVTARSDLKLPIKSGVQSSVDQQDRIRTYSAYSYYFSELHELHSNFLIMSLCVPSLVLRSLDAGNICKPGIVHSV